ncbi:MAG: hypothetical protein HYT97_10005, partial [Elusimicrobia bacterium]|nr:hypothetical protein [Elusimicrobiota bacterium]
SFQRVIEENEWIMEGDYSLWVMAHHWADLVGEILNSFLIKNRIELLELDLKTSFATKTSQ